MYTSYRFLIFSQFFYISIGIIAFSWNQWSDCSTGCGAGTRSRKCVARQSGSYSCNAGLEATENCLGNQCPIDGGWSNWNSWSSCSATCGTGSENFRRFCTNPAPENGGRQCTGVSSINRVCSSNPCPGTTWSTWSSCSATCGWGTQSRTCVITNGGQLTCTRDQVNTNNCFVKSCVKNGGWSTWSAWGSCSKTCGSGLQNTTRSCNNPVPENGGLPCTGSSFNVRVCTTDPCPEINLPKFSSDIYTSCSEALVNKKISGIYNIQPNEQSNIANISCLIINNTIGLASLDNNAEEEVLVQGYEASFSYKKNITYENFFEKGLNSFLDTTTTCSQGMTIISREANFRDHGALFWDNHFINGIGATDGICKCFISSNCIKTSDPGKSCLNGNGILFEEGLFSVNANRLPLRIIFFGDTGQHIEFVRYKIWKLKCHLKLLNINVIFPRKINCYQNISLLINYKLMDGNKETCINYHSKYVHLQIETLREITQFEIFGKNFQENNFNFSLYNKTNRISMTQQSFLFNFQPSDFLNFFTFSSKEIQFCEILIIE